MIKTKTVLFGGVLAGFCFSAAGFAETILSAQATPEAPDTTLQSPADSPPPAAGTREGAYAEESVEGVFAEETGEEISEEAKKPKPRTPMSILSFGPFSEMQRGAPPVINPSIPSLSDRRFRFGTLLEFGIGVEVGDVDDDWVSDVNDMFDDFDDLEERAQNLRASFEQAQRPSDAELEDFLNSLRDFEADSNALVDQLTSRAYVKLTSNASFPLTPIAVRSDTLRGTFALNADGFAEARGAVFSANGAFDFGLDGVTADRIETIEFDEATGREVIVLRDPADVRRIEAEPDAGVAVQGGAVARIGAGYSRQFLNRESGRLHAGTTFNFYQATMVRAGIQFDEEDLGDAAEDAFKDSDKTSTDFGIDLGVVWISRNYLVGGTVRNVIEPTFDYPDTSTSVFFNANPEARRNGNSWTMDRQFTLQGALFTADQRWIASGALDANRATDTTGDDYQWASILGSFEPRRGWVPSPRLGLRTNLAGEKLTYLTAGASFFRALHLDLSWTLDTVTVDGNKTPRGLYANLALGRKF